MYSHYQTKPKTFFAFITSITFVCSLFSASVYSQSLQDGIYTEDQATRGAEEYAARCASCHSVDLRGNSNSPGLIGLSFMFIWEGRTLGELYEKMSTEMPTDNPGSLSQQSYAAILAFILQSNEFPAGDTELAASADALANIPISSQ